MPKVIFICYPAEYVGVPQPGEDFFFLQGWGSVLARHILKHTDRYSLEVWRMDRTIKHDELRDVQGIRCRLFSSKGTYGVLPLPMSLIRALKDEAAQGPIIIHHDTVFTGGLLQILQALPQIHVVAQAHGDARPDLRLQWEPGIYSRVRLAIAERRLCRLSHAFLLRKDDLDWMSRILGGNRASLLTVGVDMERFKPVDKAKARKQLGLPLYQRIICFIGRLYELKGVHHLIELYLSLKRETNIGLLLVGANKEQPLYQAAKASDAYVIGKVDHDSVALYLSASDLYVLPGFTPQYRGIDTSCLEALACNVPVVSPNMTHFPKDDITGIGMAPATVDELGYCVRTVLANLPAYCHCREMARSYISWDSILQSVLRVYGETLNHRFSSD